MTRLFVRLSMFASLATLMIPFISCNDDDPAGAPGALAFHIHTLIDTTEVEEYGDVLTLANGREISVTQAQMYISNVRLIRTDGGVVDGPSTITLVKQGVEEYELGNVPAGNYKTVRFDIGLSDAANSSTPTATDLALNQPSMWFGSSAQPDGFVFLNFQGTIDTTLNHTGSALVPFAYKIGTNAHRVTITMPDEPFTVVSDQLAIVHLEADYAKLLDGITLGIPANLSVVTVNDNSWVWVTDFESNIAGMFQYEE